jgi:hypothetical protein
VASVGRAEHVGPGNRRHAVPRCDGQEHGALCLRREQLCDACKHGVVMAENTPEKRSPRKVDRERARQAVQDLRRMLCRDDREKRVRQRSAAPRLPRCRGHRARACIETDHERVGVGGRRSKNVAAVTGAQVEGYPGIARREASDVAVVELAEAAVSNHAEHVTRISLGHAAAQRQPPSRRGTSSAHAPPRQKRFRGERPSHVKPVADALLIVVVKQPPRRAGTR